MPAPTIQKIDGRDAIRVPMHGDFVPCAEVEATFAKICFLDGQGDRFEVVRPPPPKRGVVRLQNEKSR